MSALPPKADIGRAYLDPAIQAVESAFALGQITQAQRVARPMRGPERDSEIRVIILQPDRTAQLLPTFSAAALNPAAMRAICSGSQPKVAVAPQSGPCRHT